MYASNTLSKETPSFVRKMAKKFEQIAGSTSYEANFNHCNWWLEMPASVTCFDDLEPDLSNDLPYVEGHDNCVVTLDNDNCVVYPVAGEIASSHYVETAEVANVHENSANSPEKKTFFSRVDHCLSFLPKNSITVDVEATK